ncbi:MAG TPA: glycosyltransferase [Acidimicrobiales bacterium]|nr:glycosyltransferase [Acidimicrobiales bacterium]
MRLLVLSPDFASHWSPLSVAASAARDAGHTVVVATGPLLRPAVEAAGFEWRPLRLGAGGNDGVARGRDAAQAAALDRFIGATRAGAAATLALQADERLVDLLFEPERVVADVAAIVRDVDPDRLVVDHVSFNSTLAARATGRPFTTVVPGHPSQLPVGDERYGLPPAWPAALHPDADALDDLRARCDRVAERFTARWNDAQAAVAPHLTPVDDAFRVHGDRVVLHWSATHHDPERTPSLPGGATFAGPLTRTEAPADLPDDDRPLVYVALGTFLSHRGDVLARLATALRHLDVRAAIATGPTPAADLGPLPHGWIVAERLPQVALLGRASVAVSHGGNNSVQEALRAGVGQVVLPFSTDQFAIGADLERAGVATVVDPNSTSVDALAEAIAGRLAAAPPAPVAPDLAVVVAALTGASATAYSSS